MEKVWLHQAYFGSIAQFAALTQADTVLFEEADNYQKQTYRARQYIYGANGKLLLNIPIKHSKEKQGHQAYKSVKIENEFAWQTNHWRSLESAYRSSPFFEFYEDVFRPLYHEEQIYLLEFNQACFQKICEALELQKTIEKTTTYTEGPKAENLTDFRNLINAKREPSFAFDSYPQVFQEKQGFIPNLSILDLLFNLGPEALSYLESVLLGAN